MEITIFKKKTCLALATLTAILHHGASKNSRVSAAFLVQRYQLSPRALESTLQQLAKAGFVRSLRGGQQGGYEVASPDTLTVAEVVMALEGAALPKQSLHVFQSVLATSLAPVQTELFKHLSNITITDLARQAKHEKIGTEFEPFLDFII